MSSLRSRLNRLQGKGNDTASSELIEQQKEPIELQTEAIPQLNTTNSVQAELQDPFAQAWHKLGVERVDNAFGSFLVRSRHYQAQHFHGMYQLHEWSETAQYLNAFYPEVNADAKQFLFLDLETTGLGSGTGNIPFMIGLAYWTSSELVVQQALIRHPAEERAMLAYLHELCKNYTHLVSYNGKSFDWPLMHSRYVLNGMRETIWQPLHIDLLHPSRSLWRNTLESCKLSHIEEMRLGITRVDDVPGSEAPRLYFEFLASGDPEFLTGVYEHNELDMLSLVTLGVHFGYLLSDRAPAAIMQQPNQPEEMVRTGLWLEKMGIATYAEQLYELAVHVPTTASNTLMLLAMRDKKQRNMKRAIELWQRIVDGISRIPRIDEVEAAIELSMYYEHKEKHYSTAIHYADIALNAALELESFGKRRKNVVATLLANINKRLIRLERKSTKLG